MLIGHFAGHGHCMQHIEKSSRLARVLRGDKWYISSDNGGFVEGCFAMMTRDQFFTPVALWDHDNRLDLLHHFLEHGAAHKLQALQNWQ